VVQGLQAALHDDLLARPEGAGLRWAMELDGAAELHRLLLSHEGLRAHDVPLVARGEDRLVLHGGEEADAARPRVMGDVAGFLDPPEQDRGEGRAAEHRGHPPQEEEEPSIAAKGERAREEDGGPEKEPLQGWVSPDPSDDPERDGDREDGEVEMHAGFSVEAGTSFLQQGLLLKAGEARIPKLFNFTVESSCTAVRFSSRW